MHGDQGCKRIIGRRKGRAARQQFIHNCPQTIQVGGGLELFVLKLLGAGIEQCAGKVNAGSGFSQVVSAFS
jgi:hypothetical protein